MEKASNKILDDVIMFRLYASDALWKGNKTVAAKNLRKLTRDLAKREALKTNIRIRVNGFVWKELHITWTHQHGKRPLVELGNQLRKIIIFEKNGIHTEPPAEVLEQTPMPILGTMTDDRGRLDKKHLDTKKKVQETATNLSRERVEGGEDNIMYDSHQAWFILN